MKVLTRLRIIYEVVIEKQISYCDHGHNFVENKYLAIYKQKRRARFLVKFTDKFRLWQVAEPFTWQKETLLEYAPPDALLL